jgi:hypothetical protein
MSQPIATVTVLETGSVYSLVSRLTSPWVVSHSYAHTVTLITLVGTQALTLKDHITCLITVCTDLS